MFNVFIRSFTCLNEYMTRTHALSIKECLTTVKQVFFSYKKVLP